MDILCVRYDHHDRQQELAELRKLYDDLKSDSEYNLHRKDAEWTEEIKASSEVGDLTLRL